MAFEVSSALGSVWHKPGNVWCRDDFVPAGVPWHLWPHRSHSELEQPRESRARRRKGKGGENKEACSISTAVFRTKKNSNSFQPVP